MTFNPEQTVAEIALANPATTRVFEHLGIDYCCGGKLSLRVACERAKVPVSAALAAIEEPLAAPDAGVANDAALGEITQHIVKRHHAFVRGESPRIQALLAKVCERHGHAHPELIEVKTRFNWLDAELSQHMRKEEHILFPYIESLGDRVNRAACFDSVEHPIEAMVAEHENAGENLARIRAVTGGYAVPADACGSFRALYAALEQFERDLHVHVHLENNILFPRAIAAERELRGSAK